MDDLAKRFYIVSSQRHEGTYWANAGMAVLDGNNERSRKDDGESQSEEDPPFPHVRLNRCGIFL